ncbi:MAG: hypothetical protein ACOCQ5_05535, partial [Halanaerobiales bacterium]
MKKGQKFNESELFKDEVTSRPTRRLTKSGLYNQTPTYHYNTAFTEDSKYIVFASAREGGSTLLKANVLTGDIEVIAVIEGMGQYSEYYRSPYASGSSLGGFTGKMSVIPETNKAVGVVGKSLRIYDLDSLEEKILIDDIGKEYYFGCPIGSVDGTRIIVPRAPFHPDVVCGDSRPTRSKTEAWVEEYGGMPTTYLRIDIESGEVEEIYEEKIAGTHHVQPCPSDPDIWLIDRDLPPKFWKGGDNFKSTRAWLLNIKTKELIELKPKDENGFQVHSTWNKSGDRIYYHGPSKKGGQYIGVADLSGDIIWEQHYPASNYGHVSTHTEAEAIITDGILTSDMVTAIHYENKDNNGYPEIEILARHNTQWDGMVGQYPHPHCHMSPDG